MSCRSCSCDLLKFYQVTLCSSFSYVQVHIVLAYLGPHFSLIHFSSCSTGASAWLWRREWWYSRDEGRSNEDGHGKESDHPWTLPLPSVPPTNHHRYHAPALSAAVWHQCCELTSHPIIEPSYKDEIFSVIMRVIFKLKHEHWLKRDKCFWQALTRGFSAASRQCSIKWNNLSFWGSMKEDRRSGIQ